jgi:cryptochrome
MDPPIGINITGQLIWREYFYSLVRLNPNFNQIENNPICLDIPWRKDDAALHRWKKGLTGYPFIDAGLRQLLQEGAYNCIL